MREILFRGKNKFTGEWCEGFLVKTGDHFRISTQNDLISFGVYPESVGQYTGLSDKHQTKIFEGDIVRYAIYPPDQFVRGVVNYKDGVFRIGDQGCALCVCAADGIEEYRLEVIGNIHDNPELLQQHKDPKEE